MKHHPYAVFFDLLWDVTNPRGIDADREPDTDERRGWAVRRWLRLRRSVESPPAVPPPAVSISAPAVPTDAASEGSAPDGVATADGRVEPPGTPLATG